MARKSYDYIFKVIVIGDYGTEKNNIILRFAGGYNIDTPFISTIGVDFKIKSIQVQEKIIKLQIWDIVGGERFRRITASYFRGTMGAMLVYDITQENTFRSIENWLKQVKESENKNIQLMLLGNKCHLEEDRQVSRERGEQFAQDNNMRFLECSANTNINIDEAFYQLVEDILRDGKYDQLTMKEPGPNRKHNKRRCSLL